MGLDTTHDCFHGAYSSFNHFRNELAKAANIDTHKLDSYIEVPKVDWGQVDASAVIEGYWPQGKPDDPLYVLLMHSDCDGFIMPRHCEPLADRLEKLLPKLDNDISERTIQFIAGLREAAENWEFVQFH